jgi:hypothetical protein
VHFNSVFNPLSGNRLAGVVGPIGGLHVLPLKLKLVRVHQVPLYLLDLVLPHAHVEQLVSVTHHTLTVGVTSCCRGWCLQNCGFTLLVISSGSDVGGVIEKLNFKWGLLEEALGGLVDL